MSFQPLKPKESSEIERFRSACVMDSPYANRVFRHLLPKKPLSSNPKEKNLHQFSFQLATTLTQALGETSVVVQSALYLALLYRLRNYHDCFLSAPASTTSGRRSRSGDHNFLNTYYRAIIATKSFRNPLVATGASGTFCTNLDLQIDDLLKKPETQELIDRYVDPSKKKTITTKITSKTPRTALKLTSLFSRAIVPIGRTLSGEPAGETTTLNGLQKAGGPTS